MFPTIEQGLIDAQGILLHVKGRITRLQEGGHYGSVEENDASILVNNTMHSLFGSVDVVLGKNEVCA